MSIPTVRAVFENGVFRPLNKIQFPENVECEFEPRPVEPVQADDEMKKIYEILSRRYASGSHDTAERHNEHQP